MHRSHRPSGRVVRHERGQIIVVAALAMIAIISGVALVLEGGNAYAHQRQTQNASDAVANAGATVLAQRLGGTWLTDANVKASTDAVAAANVLDSYVAYYTDWAGNLLNAGGAITPNTNNAVQVGSGTIPPGGQGVWVGGSQRFGSTFARVIGIDQFTSSADATAVSGALTGGAILPIVFPVNIVDCATDGDLGTGEANWTVSNPDGPDAGTAPDGQEYIIPLCKTDAGSFMILDLDGTANNCDDEVANPPPVHFYDFPVDVASDNGNNCAKPMVDEVNRLHGTVVLIPICDGDCVTTGGSSAEYHIIRVVALYLDYMSDQNGGTNPACVGNGTTLVTIRGNGSSSCLAGWFVRYITTGEVGSGPIQGAGAIGVQLKK